MPSPAIESFRVFKADERFGGEMESREECLREAAECDRLAGLASTQGVRTLNFDDGGCIPMAQAGGKGSRTRKDLQVFGL